MFAAFYEQFLASFPLLVAYHDAHGFEAMTAFQSAVPRQTTGFMSRFNKE